MIFGHGVARLVLALYKVVSRFVILVELSLHGR